MAELLKSLVVLLLRAILALRYRVAWRGLDAIAARRRILFLPNHPAEIDPVLLVLRLYARFRPRAVCVEDFYYLPGVHFLLRLIRAIPIPNVSLGGSQYQRLRVTRTLDEICASLGRDENVLIYPAGQMMRSTQEELRGASGTWDILHRVPDANVVLIRTRGLLGSSFAWVTAQQRPDLGQAIRRGLLWTLANLLVFNPRRRVSVEFADVTASVPRGADKAQLNRWLEAWYNQDGDEAPTAVSYCRWWPVHAARAAGGERAARPATAVPDEIRRRVTAEIARIVSAEPGRVTDNLSLAGDLGFDSLNSADLIAWLEETFFVTDLDPGSLVTVADVLAAAVGSTRPPAEVPAIAAPRAWADRGPRPPLELPDPERNLVLTFLTNCDRMGAAVALGDETGVLTYRQVKTAVLALADVIQRETPDARVGIMLPASVGAGLVVMAALLAGKVPVMINWTVGDASLEHVLKVSGISRILTSRRFLDRLEQLNFELLKDHLLTLEDLRATRLTLGVKLRAWLRRGRAPAALCRLYGADRRTPDDITVILFTSGSESLPKGVPLSQRNILSDLAGAARVADIRSSDVALAFLPPFHSFGFTVTTVFPLLAGIKAVCYPNPTESRKVVQTIAAWRPTLICGTPTFLAGLLKVAAPGQLASLRLAVCGAEKTPQALFDQAAALGITVLEGYGITETSPVLTLTAPGQPRVGVGRPIGDVELRIVHPETRAPVPGCATGLILARGTNVFRGYLDRESTSAFQELEGQRYYVTGDLGFLDAAGNLTLVGRLKRFVKIGGEMISLPAMEEALARQWPSADGSPHLAVVAGEVEGDRPALWLFAAVAVTLADANAALKAAGFPNLARLSNVARLDALPLLGTGKTDYRQLGTRLRQELGRPPVAS